MSVNAISTEDGRSIPAAGTSAALQRDTEAVLTVSGLRRTYGDTVVAVDGVDFSIHPGEIVTLLGPSGCGKSTTLRTVMGLERANGGTITYQGRVVESETVSVPSNKRDMGMVFQSYAVWPHMTVAENVSYPLHLRKWKKPRIAEAVDEVLALVGLEDFHDRPSTKLSGGQQQRVALARALVYRPGLLLLDEPFSNLDARLRDEMRSEVKAIQREIGIAVLFVTHDQQEALSMSDRIVLMRQGRVLQSAGPEELYNHPSSPAARDFLGQTLVFRGEVVEKTGNRTSCRLTEAGTIIHGIEEGSGRPLNIGDACEISIRPEQAAVTREPADRLNEPLAVNQIRVKVTAALFLGDRRELQIVTARGQKARVFAPLEERHVEGDRIVIELPEVHVRVWPADATKTSSAPKATITREES
ncbi:ABC-type Fe3+/spermidine/putrescine transport system ATPase subunit [Arthrobacter ginsengisoli]|uniref:ABC-type Fe3+/spermidine/putrescine transport system ATPase subunit n=1 Tax=Arthrobacter ginsengisoli TaxID=1356565 RepID=A0ABU1UDM1_9MICC|nr:ABC transporter ATP-binding protein [Arthrobacter ginsengisoli]MDR7083287.1 ABC-type Fe3+/spermidine/putrescine transport system ATPase subunit [Arthrobacter ginsengisoli]